MVSALIAVKIPLTVEHLTGVTTPQLYVKLVVIDRVMNLVNIKQTMKHKHTPGPWHHDEYGHICAGPQIIGKAYQFELDDSDYDELPCIPNARLMAAAPELLEVLELLLLYSRGEGMGYDETYHRAEKLIAKIEGDE